MKNFVSNGDTMNYTAGANIASGAGVLAGNILGVAIAAIPNGEQGALQIEGVVELLKTEGTVFGAGDSVNWNNSTGRIIGTSSTMNNVGVAWSAAAANDPTIKVKLTPGGGFGTP